MENKMKHLLIVLLTLITFNQSAIASDKILDIQAVKTPNGITAWLVEDTTLPLISLKFSFQGAGAINDGKDKQGLTRLLSNTMDEGAGELKSQQFQKELSDHSITLHFNANRDNFGGEIKTLSRHKDKAFKLLKLALTKPRFDQDPINRMRQANISRIKSNMTDPQWITARIFNDKAFSGQPYQLNSGGTLSTLPQITSDDLRLHVKNYLTKDRLVIGVTGDIKKDELIDLLDNSFNDLPKTGLKLKRKAFSLQNLGKTYLFEKDIPQTILSVSLPSVSIHDPDYFSLKLMNHLYGASGFGSRLMKKAREKEGLTYGIYSSLLHQDLVDGLSISTSTKNTTAARMFQIIEEEMHLMANQKTSEEDLQKAKDYMIGSLPLSLTSTDKIASILLNLQLNNRPIDYLDKYATSINAVDTNDIQRIAQKVFTNQKTINVMVGKPQINDTMTGVLEKIEGLNNVE